MGTKTTPNPVPGQPPIVVEAVVTSDPETIRMRIFNLTTNKSNAYLQGDPEDGDVSFHLNIMITSLLTSFHTSCIRSISTTRFYSPLSS
jgi:hypothetical protein